MTLLGRKIKQVILILTIIISIIFFLLTTFLTSAHSADYEVIFNHLDEQQDDFGPGSYHYPLNDIFQNKGHLFDIKSFTIYEAEEKYMFSFAFNQLTDPWEAKYGFSLPLLELYIDNQDGGSSELFHSGANVTFPDDFKWNKFLKISGWWVRLFTPNSQKKDLLNLNDVSLEDPYQAETSEVEKEENTIKITINKSELGSLDNSAFILLVGSFDPFGYDHFRSFSREKNSWQIYTESEQDIQKLPRVMDILVPEGMSQRDILKYEMAEVPYFRVKVPEKKDSTAGEQDRLAGITSSADPVVQLLFFLYLLIILAVVFYYRRH